MEDYGDIRRTHVTSTGLRKFIKSPKHFQCWLEEDQVETEAFIIGRAFHKWVLEGKEEFNKSFLVNHPDFINSKTEKQFWFSTKSYHAAYVDHGKHSIPTDDFHSMIQMDESIRNHPIASKIISSMHSQEKIFKNPMTGRKVPCAIRVDAISSYCTNPIIVDLKTVNDLDEFARDAIRYGYQIQAQFYLDVLSEYMAWSGVQKEPPVAMMFVCVEKDEPYRTGCFHCQPNIGGTIRQYLIEFDECVKNNRWPTRFEGLSYL